MQAHGIVFTGKEQVEFRPIEVAEPAAGQVLVETTRTLISTGTECICFQRKFAPGTHWDAWVKYPFPTGYSNVGRVLRVGAGVTHVKPGDRVANTCQHATHVVAPDWAVFPIPNEVSDDAATWSTLVYITQHGFRKPQVALGETVVVIGVGLLGQLIVQYASLSGAGRVIAIDPAKKRLEMAAAHGATHTLAIDIDNANEPVRDITRGKMADVVFDMTGHSKVFAKSLELLRKHGRLGLIGDTGSPAEQHLTPDVLKKDLRIFGAHAGNAPNVATDEAPWSKSAMVDAFFNFVASGRMRVDDLATHRFAPRDAAEAYNLLVTRRDEAMGVVFDFTKV